MADPLIGILIVGGLYAIGSLFDADSRLKRRLRKANVWPIAELPEDTYGRIVGQADVFETELIAPMSGRRCVYYKVDVQNGNDEVLEETKAVSFVVHDDTGRAVVDPSHATVVLVRDSTTTSGSFVEPTAAQKALLERHGETSDGWIYDLKLTYREAVIEIGERVTVRGAGVREPDPDGQPTGGYRGGPPTRLRLTSSDRYPLEISDDPKVL